jgi:hypothetical protein
MSSRYAKHDRVWTFNCDGATCRKNFEGDTGDDFRVAWVAARAAGWVNSQVYLRSISTWQHYCPTCKKELGD